MSVSGYFDTPLDLERRKRTGRSNPSNPLNKAGTRVSKEAAGHIAKVIDRIERYGWAADGMGLSIGEHMRAVTHAGTWTLDYLVTRLGGKSVLIWEREPGRTQGEVLEMLRKAGAR